MKCRALDKITVSSRLEDTIKAAIEEGYRQKSQLRATNKWKKQVAAAAAAVIIGTTAFGIAFSTQAKEIPVIGNIFAYLSESKMGNYAEYKDFSKSLEMVQENKGIKLTLNDAIYDGTTVMLTYTMVSEEDLGDEIIVDDWLNIKGYKGGMTGSSGVYQVGDKTYIGFIRISIDEVREELNVKYNIDRLYSRLNNSKGDFNIKGNWDFKFNIKKTDTDILMANKGAIKDGVKVNVDKITFTPMSTIIHYSQQIPKEVLEGYFGAYTVLAEVKDDLGNVYSGEGNGGSGKRTLMNFTATYEKVDKNATKLIITPKVGFEVLGEDGHRTIGPHILESDEKEVLDYLKKKGIMPKEVFLDDIVVELK
jgi:hypothetical protein